MPKSIKTIWLLKVQIGFPSHSETAKHQCFFYCRLFISCSFWFFHLSCLGFNCYSNTNGSSGCNIWSVCGFFNLHFPFASQLLFCPLLVLLFWRYLLRQVCLWTLFLFWTHVKLTFNHIRSFTSSQIVAKDFSQSNFGSVQSATDSIDGRFVSPIGESSSICGVKCTLFAAFVTWPVLFTNSASAFPVTCIDLKFICESIAVWNKE